MKTPDLLETKKSSPRSNGQAVADSFEKDGASLRPPGIQLQSSHEDGCGCGECSRGVQMKPVLIQQKGHDEGCGCGSCTAAQMKKDNVAPQVLQRVDRPANVRDITFCGATTPSGRGVNPAMRRSLERVEADLRTKYAAIPDGEDKPATFEEYAGVASIKGWRDTTSQHGTGNAVDVNYREHPYIATRTDNEGRTVHGGEGGRWGAQRVQRAPAVAVYDRAVSFLRTDESASATAEVDNRLEGESATGAYRRFKRTSDALRDYLSMVFLSSDTDVEINRDMTPNPETASEADLLRAIPQSERHPEETALGNIQARMDDPAWQRLHPDYPLTAREQYVQILRDFELVRRPMQYGNPDASPRHTRNPARGFLHFSEHLVVSMMEVGNLRWGACEFGPHSNGDVHHFDLIAAHHTEVPELIEPDTPSMPVPAEEEVSPSAS